MKVTETSLPGVLLVEPDIFGDARGFFYETWQLERYRSVGINDQFVQDNLSFSSRGVLRGLHFQQPHAQGKLVYVMQGEVFDVAVDIRVGSPSFGQWVGARLSGENKRQLYVPKGFAHGFCVTSDTALFAYKCTDFYASRAEASVLWSDPDIGIEWPVKEPSLSEKDRNAKRLRDIDTTRLPRYETLD